MTYYEYEKTNFTEGKELFLIKNLVNLLNMRSL